MIACLRFTFVSLLLIAGVPSIVSAASLYIDPPISQLFRGDSLTMSVRLDIDEQANECVNVVDAIITYPPSIEPVDISIGDSILRFWVEEPTIHKDTRTVTFAGGIPNGYCGRIPGDPRLTNTVARIVFRSPGTVIGMGDEASKEASVAFGEETTVYLNDGQGTKAPLTTYSATVSLADSPGSTMQNEWKSEVSADDLLPEEFSIYLERNDTAFGGSYAIIFNTTDKQTGVDHYEVMEEPVSKFSAFEWGGADAAWIEARSPYILTDQSLNSIIRVKAIDKAGNEYIATLIPDPSMRTISQAQMLMYAMIVLLTLILIVVAIMLARTIRFHVRARRQRQSTSPTVIGDLDDTVADDVD